MSTTSTKRPHAEAKADAAAFYKLFAPATYQRWSAAGSLRRLRPEVGDVEHVVIPAYGVRPSGDLFGDTERVNLLWSRLDELVADGTVAKHLYGGTGYRWGERYRGVDYRGFLHELFAADADNWGSVLAIRTGPGSYSKMLVCGLQRHGHVNDGGYVWDKRAVACPCGWAGPFDALRRVEAGAAPGARWTNGHGEPVVCPGCGKGDALTMVRVSVPDEHTYFRLAGVPWAEPRDRVEVPAAAVATRG